ncbi:MAG: hypothetical protein ABR579_08245 [Actinomycetota bacterium]|nr:hypothetical protein [Actinomycetota bacterium]
MRKLVALAVSAVIAGSLLAVPAYAGKAKPQTVSGTIAAPAPYTDPSGCFAGITRRIAILTGEQAGSGAVGYYFNIDPGTVGKPFNLDVSSALPAAPDADITFYQKFGTTDDVTGDPLNAGSPATVGFATRAPGGEHGIVPKGYPKAIICVYADSNGGSAAANFTYTAGPGVKPTK